MFNTKVVLMFVLVVGLVLGLVGETRARVYMGEEVSLPRYSHDYAKQMEESADRTIASKPEKQPEVKDAPDWLKALPKGAKY